tara:strand:+ start:3288 stop:3617 length:330 start_codon:yes stop_codon:yes gene_type:complete
MTKKYKITEIQLKKMIDFGKSFPQYQVQPKKDYTFYYTHLTPEDVYVKYQSYFLTDDNSFGSEIEIQCINKEGEMRDCMEQFKTYEDKMQFTSDFIELYIDDLEVVRFK